MAFPQKDVNELLAACHRRCCICHRFCGFKMELDHMIPKSENGPDDIGNAIPVCFECHAEIHAYNDQHPRGRKYRAEELKMHKEQWIATCKSSAAFLASIPPIAEVGPVQALIDELEFNEAIASQTVGGQVGALFETEQFNRCVSEGILSLLHQQLKTKLHELYVAFKRMNNRIASMGNFDPRSDGFHEVGQLVLKDLQKSMPSLQDALKLLRETLKSE